MVHSLGMGNDFLPWFLALKWKVEISEILCQNVGIFLIQSGFSHSMEGRHCQTFSEYFWLFRNIFGWCISFGKQFTFKLHVVDVVFFSQREAHCYSLLQKKRNFSLCRMSLSRPFYIMDMTLHSQNAAFKNFRPAKYNWHIALWGQELRGKWTD